MKNALFLVFFYLLTIRAGSYEILKKKNGKNVFINVKNECFSFMYNSEILI